MPSLDRTHGYHLRPLAGLKVTMAPPPKGWMALADIHDGPLAVIPSGILMRNLRTGTYAMWDGAVHMLEKAKVENGLRTVELDDVGRVINAGLPPRDPRKAELAHTLRRWREAADLSRSDAAAVLGIPARTIERIEQLGTFPYPKLLMIALLAFGVEPNSEEADDGMAAAETEPQEAD